MTENLDLAQLRTTIQTAQSAPSAGLVMKLIQELEEARARHRKAWGRAEAAEAAVARVREVATVMATHSLPEAPRGGAWETAHGAQLFAKDILEALDGGEQDV